MSELISQVRQTKTLNGGSLVYENANIEVDAVYATEVSPTALYVLMPGIRWLSNQADRLSRKGVNLFDLKEVYQDECIKIGPPLIEWSDNTWVIVDGIHRFWLGMKESFPVRAIMVRGSDPNFPLVGLPVGWGDVKAYEIRPEDPRLLKKIRPGVEDTSEYLRKYYRDLSYLGGRGRRPRKGQNG